MRELKFRAWDMCNDCWSDEYLASTEDGRIIEFNTDGSTEEWKDRFLLEQYTGLKDKNGKEIYEGDIIQEEIDFNSKMTDGVFTYVVEWDNDTLSYGLRGSGNSIHDELWEVNASVEIVGNIHENQDLLGDTNVTNKEKE